MALYDAFNPDARKYYWNLMDEALFKIGVDAWWLDTTEPETEGREDNILSNNKIALGSGARYANMFPLMTTSAGLRRTARGIGPEARIHSLSFRLCRRQRNAVTAWSGDINSDLAQFQTPDSRRVEFLALRTSLLDNRHRRIRFRQSRMTPQYRELFIRWFQFGTFNPILRVHGTREPQIRTNSGPMGRTRRKFWSSYDSLRYRLLPYIYSLAWKTTSESYTPMRPLVMDFRNDVRAQNIGDQFMYRPGISGESGNRTGSDTRHLYLPKAKWYDFWTGATSKKAASALTPAPSRPHAALSFARDRSCRWDPKKNGPREKPADPIELRIYRGADGDFTLYEDENDNYDYEKGVYATIPFHWDDAKQTLP